MICVCNVYQAHRCNYYLSTFGYRTRRNEQAIDGGVAYEPDNDMSGVAALTLQNPYSK